MNMKRLCLTGVVVSVVMASVGCETLSKQLAREQYSLGALYANGIGVGKDSREAVRWWRKAAAKGNADAQYALGVTYVTGDGVGKDPREAVRWWRQAAEQGHAKAQYNLGVAYRKGEGVITDMREAYIWYFIVKENGDEDAAETLREKHWHDYLSQAEIRSAQEEAARRMEAIENR